MDSQQAEKKEDQQQQLNDVCDNNTNTYIESDKADTSQENQTKKDVRNIEKQQSLDLYLELKYVESNQQNQDEVLTFKSKPSLKINPLVSVEDSSDFPQLNLQPSPKSHKPIEIKITGYRTSTFLGMKTQIFALKITDLNKCPVRQYQIERRFSDFADLYEQLFYNHPGYILYPFPDKTLETFIKIKIGIATDSTEKLVLVEKRLGQLEAFVNAISQHKQLRNSEELQIFLTQDDKYFEQGKTRVNKFVDEYKQLSTKSQLNNIVGLGKSMLNSYFRNGTTQQLPTVIFGPEKKLMAEAFQIVKLEKQKFNKKIAEINLLLQAEKQFSRFIQINTDSDVLLKFITKHNSNREFSQSFATFLETILDQLNIAYRKLEEVEKNLVHYFNIVEEILNAKNALDLQKKAKLERMLERLEKNFEIDWLTFFESHKEEFQLLVEDFVEKWKEYKANAGKIWKKTK